MSELTTILKQYQKLSSWCAEFWNKVYSACSNDIACNAGCGICCELQSVSLLEAYVIYKSIRSGDYIKEYSNNEKCVFLFDDKCSIYSARPLICRTHGLAIKSREFTTSYSITCPYNFQNTDLDTQKKIILDMDMITENIMKLNLAFCIVNNVKDYSQERILLRDIAYGSFPENVAHVFEV